MLARRAPRLLPLALLSTLLTGCSLLFGVSVKPIAVAAQPPGNVAVYLEVKDLGKAVPDLRASDFTLFEDGRELPSEATGLTLLDPSTVAEAQTLLLVDGSLGGGPDLAKATSSFVSRLRRGQDVSVYVFDGTPLPTLVGTYPRATDGAAANVAVLESFKAKDVSRDLHGNMVQALKKLEQKLASGNKPIRIGTLVTFVRGPDLAGRVTREELSEQMKATGFSLYAIGIEPEAGKSQDVDLDRLGPAGVIRAQTANTVDVAFDTAASKLAEDANRFYLMAYCSPARAGMRVLRVQVKASTEAGRERTGSADVQFSASGFGPGCKAQTPPRFAPVGSDPAAAKTKAPAATANPAVTTSPSASPAPAPSQGDGTVPPPESSRYKD